MSETESSRVKISCQNLWKIFGPDPQHAINLATDGMTKEKLLEETGHVIAVKDVSFEVSENEIFVIMGLSGSGWNQPGVTYSLTGQILLR